MMYGDNYFDLFPDEKKRVPVELHTAQTLTGTIKGTLIVGGTNVHEIRIPVRLAGGQ